MDSKATTKKKHEPVTWGFVQVWLDKQTSTSCKSRLWFGLDKLLSTLVLNFNFFQDESYFQSAAAVGRRNTNATPAQSPARSATLIENYGITRIND